MQSQAAQRVARTDTPPEARSMVASSLLLTGHLAGQRRTAGAHERAAVPTARNIIEFAIHRLRRERSG